MDRPIELVVFADDWGRHPSSAQHLVRHLLPAHPTLWVNTVGTRRPRLSDVRRIGGVLRGWLPVKQIVWDTPKTEANLRVISPRMYPGFRTGWQRRLNARLLTKAVVAALKPGDPAGGPHVAQCASSAGSPGFRRVAVTTLPITADLVGRIPGVDRWVYYCVDDFSVWPGADHAVMDAMERELVAKVDAVVCVSEVLRERIRSMRREAELLTHGVDLDHFARADRDTSQGPQMTSNAIAIGGGWQPHFLFWGLTDERLDSEWVLHLARALEGSEGRIHFLGPSKSFASALADHPNVVQPWNEPYEFLPAHARSNDALIMPYRDLPVTRAMQPLKLLEYLATYKPVVVRDLPATRAWADCCDVVSTAEEFVRVCLERAKTGLPPEQRAARERRLPGESWSEKARRFEQVLFGSR